MIVSASSEGGALGETKDFQVPEGAYRKLAEKGLRRTGASVAHLRAISDRPFS